MEQIKIKCTGAQLVALSDLHAFQGNLKDLSKESYEKLKKQILKLGFSEPFSVWEHEGKFHLLNGHQRARTLQQMGAEGYEIPKLPVSLVEASSVKEAKQKVLSLTAQYGEITKQGLYEFLSESDLDVSEIEDLRLPEINTDEFKLEFFDEGVTKLAPGCDEDEVPEHVEPKTKLGDVMFFNPRYECPACKKIYTVEEAKELGGECKCQS